MIQQEVLPITFNSWLDTDIYYLLTKMMTGINSIDAVFQGGGAFHIYLDWREDNREDNIKLKYLINVDPKTYSKVRFLKPEMIDTDKFVVLMPFSVWQDFLTKSKDLATGKKKTAARVFVYLYYWAMRNRGSYGHPRNRMIEELKINNNKLAEALEWLERNFLIMRGNFFWFGNIHARQYMIPEEMWTIECKIDFERNKNAKTSCQGLRN